MSGGGQTQTTVSNSAPWSGQQPYLTAGFQKAQQYLNGSSPSYYPGSTVANQSPYTLAANQGIASRAANGSPLNSAAGGYLSNVLNGSFLNAGNPYQAALNKSISDAVIPTVESQFSSAGRYGSPAMAGTMTTALANAIAPSMYGNYQQERGNQQNAMQFAPTLANQDWMDLSQLGQLGQQQDAYGQNLVNADINRWNWNQNLPLNKLGQYMSMVGGGNYGSQATSTQTVPSGGLGGFLGGLLGGIL